MAKNLNNRKPAEGRVQRTRAAAKKQVAENGTVQFRVDEQTVLRLMTVADIKKTPLGVLVRLWAMERLIEEETKLGIRS